MGRSLGAGRPVLLCASLVKVLRAEPVGRNAAETVPGDGGDDHEETPEAAVTPETDVATAGSAGP
ncbi:hypothetical protein HW130_03605 [Streptomyces sp. PKU-EA00015]|uniref:hypothetical protein n=1 Tax=Streptomyces sp. PKU-EA00015 TaxID=2748326 RepID=UPI0015A37EC1|nr:hypothetical protein [Streptomyces sp. PKU-EA00015]NWF25357.1 hypothetical protein [Streptomyces sp. PKU-EA00015]